jgi:hypothetical protein
LGLVKAELDRQEAKRFRRRRRSGRSGARRVQAGREQTSVWPEACLNEAHLMIARRHGLTDEVVAAAGLRSVDTNEARSMLPGCVSQLAPLPALGIPIADLGVPHVGSWLLRPDQPRSDKRGRPIKYENVRGAAWRPFYVLPNDGSRVLSSNDELWITEGVFDALALESKGCAALGLTAGVFGWLAGGRPRDEWARINLRGRSVKIAFDADQTENPLVRQAATRLASFLSTGGALPVNIQLPAGDLSDYVAGGGDPLDLVSYPPVDQEPYMIARDIIDDRYGGTRYKLAVALLNDMQMQGLEKSSRSMRRLARMAGVSKHSAERFGREVALGELPPFAADGWHRWNNGWNSRILILETVSLDALKEGGSIRTCVQCHQRLPAGSRSTRQYCSDRCRKRASRAELCGVRGRIMSRKLAISGGGGNTYPKPQAPAPSARNVLNGPSGEGASSDHARGPTSPAGCRFHVGRLKT